MGEAANEWTKRKIREAFKNVRPVKGRIRVPEETTGYIVGLEKENDRLRARITELEAREKRLVAALEPLARRASQVDDGSARPPAAKIGGAWMVPVMLSHLQDARAELDAVKEDGDER